MSSRQSRLLLAEEKLSVPQTDSAEIADTLASGVVKHHRVVHLGRNPHAGAGTVLLEVNFINRPQINAGVSCQCAEFFYAWLVLAGQPEQLKAAVCAGESLTGETTSGTDAPLAPPRTSAPSNGRAFCHPRRRRLAHRTRPEFAARRSLRRPSEPDSSGKGGQDVLPRLIQPSHPFRSGESNSPPCAVRLPAHPPLRDN